MFTMEKLSNFKHGFYAAPFYEIPRRFCLFIDLFHNHFYAAPFYEIPRRFCLSIDLFHNHFYASRMNLSAHSSIR